MKPFGKLGLVPFDGQAALTQEGLQLILGVKLRKGAGRAYLAYISEADEETKGVRVSAKVKAAQGIGRKRTLPVRAYVADGIIQRTGVAMPAVRKLLETHKRSGIQ